MFTKQVSIVTPAAAFAALLWLRPRRAWVLLLVTGALGALVLALLTWWTHGGILRHLFLYNLNRFDMSRLIPNLRHGTSRSDRLFLLAGVAGFVVVARHWWRARARSRHVDLCAAMALLLVPIATLSLVTTGKSGASSSYYMQWEAALAVFAGVFLATVLAMAFEHLARGRTVAAALCAALPLAAALWPLTDLDTRHVAELQAIGREDAALVDVLKPVKGVVISTEMAVLMRTHRSVVWEPAIFAELARVGRWDERSLARLIEHHGIAAVVADGERGDESFDERFNPAIADAIDRALPRKVAVGDRVVHLPAVERPASGAASRLQ